MKLETLMLGNLGESNSPKGKFNWTDTLKTIRLAIVAGIAGFLGIVATNLPLLDFIEDSQWDNMMITLFLIPLVEIGRRWAAHYAE